MSSGLPSDIPAGSLSPVTLSVPILQGLDLYPLLPNHSFCFLLGSDPFPTRYQPLLTSGLCQHSSQCLLDASQVTAGSLFTVITP